MYVLTYMEVLSLYTHLFLGPPRVVIYNVKGADADNIACLPPINLPFSAHHEIFSSSLMVSNLKRHHKIGLERKQKSQNSIQGNKTQGIRKLGRVFLGTNHHHS